MKRLQDWTAEDFGSAMAKAIRENPYSGNYALVSLAIQLETGDEADSWKQLEDLVERMAGEGGPP